jgi:hypothetical protein
MSDVQKSPLQVDAAEDSCELEAAVGQIWLQVSLGALRQSYDLDRGTQVGFDPVYSRWAETCAE